MMSYARGKDFWLTDMSNVHEHGHTHVVHQAEGGPIGKESVPQIQDRWQRKLTTKEETNPSARGGGKRKGEDSQIYWDQTFILEHPLSVQLPWKHLGNRLIRVVNGSNIPRYIDIINFINCCMIHSPVLTCHRSEEEWPTAADAGREWSQLSLAEHCGSCPVCGRWQRSEWGCEREVEVYMCEGMRER